MNKKILSTLAIALTVLVGCTSDGTSTEASSSVFVGAWLKNNCEALGSVGGKTVYGNQVTMSIAASVVYNVSRAWVDDSSCTADQEAWVETMIFSYVTSASDLGSDIYNFDSTLAGGTWEIKTADGATVLNGASQCGQTDWTSGQTYEQESRGCFDSMPIGTVFYSIGQVSGTTLTFADSPSTSESTRPTALGTDEVFQKQ